MNTPDTITTPAVRRGLYFKNQNSYVIYMKDLRMGRGIRPCKMVEASKACNQDGGNITSSAISNIERPKGPLQDITFHKYVLYMQALGMHIRFVPEEGLKLSRPKYKDESGEEFTVDPHNLLSVYEPSDITPALDYIIGNAVHNGKNLSTIAIEAGFEPQTGSYIQEMRSGKRKNQVSYVISVSNACGYRMCIFDNVEDAESIYERFRRVAGKDEVLMADEMLLNA